MSAETIVQGAGTPAPQAPAESPSQRLAALCTANLDKGHVERLRVEIETFVARPALDVQYSVYLKHQTTGVTAYGYSAVLEDAIGEALNDYEVMNDAWTQEDEDAAG